MIITELQAETTYSVTVAAYTTKGDGARSKPKLITTTGAGKTLLALSIIRKHNPALQRCETPLNPLAHSSECGDTKYD